MTDWQIIIGSSLVALAHVVKSAMEKAYQRSDLLDHGAG